MNVERHCKHWVGPVYDCQKYGICPYAAESYVSCEYWCGADEPEDDPPEWFCVTFEDAADEPEYEDPPVWVCEGYPGD